MAEQKALAVVSVGPAVFPAGVSAAVPVSLAANGAEVPATLVLAIAPSNPDMRVLDVLPAPSLAASGKTLSFRLAGTAGRIAVFGGALPLPEGVLFHVVTNLAPELTPGTVRGFSVLPGVTAAAADASTVSVDTTAPGVTIGVLGGRHAGDYLPDWQVSVSELLRIVQFYNTGAFHCGSGTEDGFAPGPGATDCASHNADYSPQDWNISFSELLRMIQFYNAGCYGPLQGTEDGFAPCPFYPQP